MLGLAFSLFEGNSTLSLGRHGSLFNGNKKNPCFAIILFDHISDFSLHQNEKWVQNPLVIQRMTQLVAALLLCTTSL